ncbi:MAG: hypothetical protein M3Z75_15360 [Actinomycetota bacterium]|nr:hypothetical protein [Actinomycetota bacterium]
MPKHKGRKREGGFRRFLRRLFSVRTGALGSVASPADPLHVESGPARPHRRK